MSNYKAYAAYSNTRVRIDNVLNGMVADMDLADARELAMAILAITNSKRGGAIQDPFTERKDDLVTRLREHEATIALLSQQIADKREIIRKLTT